MYEILHPTKDIYPTTPALKGVYDLANGLRKCVECCTRIRGVRFLSQKRSITGNPNKKKDPGEVKRISRRFLKDTIAITQEYRSNPPYTELACLRTSRFGWEKEKG